MNALIFVNCFNYVTFDLYCSMRCVIVLVKQYDDDDVRHLNHITYTVLWQAELTFYSFFSDIQKNYSGYPKKNL